MEFENMRNELLNISGEMDKVINGLVKIGEYYYVYGKKWDGKTEVKLLNNNCQRDFRDTEIDDEVVCWILNNVINKRTNEFLNKCKDGDTQTMFFGCLLNIYYSSGLFDRCGILDLNEFLKLIDNEVTKKYIEEIEKMHLQQINTLFMILCGNGMFPDEKIKKYLVDQNEDILDSVSGNFSLAKGFIREYMKAWETFSQISMNNDLSLENLRKICPEYQYANLLFGLFSLKNYLECKTEGRIVAKYVGKLDENVINVSLGLVGQHRVLLNAPFIRFGFPYIDFGTAQDEIKHISNEIPLEKEKKLTYKYMEEYAGILYPYKIYMDYSEIMGSSIKHALQLEVAQENERKAKEDKNNIIRQFSHTYMNMKATSLYNIAQELLKNPDIKYRNYGRKLIYEYTVKEDLTKDVEMLNLRFADRNEDLYKRISNSILSENETEEGVSINGLVDNALIRCMFTLVHDGSSEAKKLRERFIGYDWISIRNSFENEIVLADTRNIQKWFSENMFPLEINISGIWEKQKFKKDFYASLIFVDTISELLTNVFRYSDKNKLVKLEFSSEGDTCYILSENHIQKDSLNFEYGGYGLQSEAGIFKIINRVNGLDINALEIDKQDGMFRAKFQFSKKLFEKEGINDEI